VDREADGDDQRGDDDGHPPAFAELLDQRHTQDARSHGEADAGEREPVEPTAILSARSPPIDAQSEERQGEGQEYVDRIEHDQEVDTAAAPEDDDQRREPHDQDPILRHQASRQMAELVW
jgi:hypothetical protein